MNKFDYAWEYLKENEGGYCDNLYDNGGATKYGISLKFLQTISMNSNGEVTATVCNGDINGDGKVDKEDIVLLSEKTAKGLYKDYFWIPANCEAIKSVKVGIKLFDMAVNFGVRTAAKLVQKAINSCQTLTLVVDGVIGSKTIAAINGAKELVLIAELVKLCKERYNKIVERDATQKRFIKGWISRAERVPV